MMYTRNEIDSITVVITMIARSVTEPRIRHRHRGDDAEHGVQDQNRNHHRQRRRQPRAENIADRLPVAQLLPQLKVKMDLTKIHSCTYHGSFRPLLANRLDLLRRRKQAAENLRRVATEELEQEEYEQNDPGQRRDHLPQSA